MISTKTCFEPADVQMTWKLLHCEASTIQFFFAGHLSFIALCGPTLQIFYPHMVHVWCRKEFENKKNSNVINNALPASNMACFFLFIYMCAVFGNVGGEFNITVVLVLNLTTHPHHTFFVVQIKYFNPSFTEKSCTLGVRNRITYLFIYFLCQNQIENVHLRLPRK